jgi:mannose-6-phosphate isomerase-like protein (cupin superfamily)
MSTVNTPANVQQQADIANQVNFSMRGLPLLSSGATMASLGRAKALWAHSKVYSTGGENSLHSHETEDHCFMVLQGEATFHFGDGSSFVARPFEGVVLPRGTLYRFASSSEENLVMFRVGSALVANSDDVDPHFQMPREALNSRSAANGQYADGLAKKNGAHSQPTVFIEGAFFCPEK